MKNFKLIDTFCFHVLIALLLVSFSNAGEKTLSDKLPPLSKSKELSTPGAKKPKSKELSTPGAKKPKSKELSTPSAKKPKSKELSIPGPKKPKSSSKKSVGKLTVIRGACCNNATGTVTSSTKLSCERKKEGKFFLNHTKAQRVCDARTGYCCMGDGKVKKSSRGNCDDKEGFFFLNNITASKKCLRTKGYCCTGEKVVRMKLGTCNRKKGSFSTKKNEAILACKLVKGLCCINDEVRAMSRGRCKDRKGKFTLREKGLPGFCKQSNYSLPRVTGQTLSVQKQKTTPAVLSRKVGQQNSLAPEVPANLGQSKQLPGTAGKDIGKRNNLGGRLPEGHGVPASGFGKRGGASGLAKGIGDQGGIGSVEEEFADQIGPVVKTGAGAQRQEQDEEGNNSISLGKHEFNNVSDEDFKVMKDAIVNETHTEDELALLYPEYLRSDRNKDGKKIKEEKVADGGPVDGEEDGPVDPDKIKGGAARGPAGDTIRGVPGEEANEEGGTVDYRHLGEILSGQTQVHTFDGGVPASNNFEDLSKESQRRVKEGIDPKSE